LTAFYTKPGFIFRQQAGNEQSAAQRAGNNPGIEAGELAAARIASVRYYRSESVRKLFQCLQLDNRHCEVEPRSNPTLAAAQKSQIGCFAALVRYADQAPRDNESN
jgi:hypothetical protein